MFINTMTTVINTSNSIIRNNTYNSYWNNRYKEENKHHQPQKKETPAPSKPEMYQAMYGVEKKEEKAVTEVKPETEIKPIQEVKSEQPYEKEIEQPKENPVNDNIKEQSYQTYPGESKQEAKPEPKSEPEHQDNKILSFLKKIFKH